MRILNLKRTSSACPSQWEGVTEDNRPVYIRFRHGCFSMDIGEPKETIDSLLSSRLLQAATIFIHVDKYSDLFNSGNMPDEQLICLLIGLGHQIEGGVCDQERINKE